jgi:hypothetical protein
VIDGSADRAAIPPYELLIIERDAKRVLELLSKARGRKAA